MARLGTFNLHISLKTDDEKKKVGADVSLDYTPYQKIEGEPLPMESTAIARDEFIVSGPGAFNKIAKRLKAFMSEHWPEAE